MFLRLHCPSSKGKIAGICVIIIGKKGSAMKTYQTAGENSGGFTNCQSPQCGGFGRVLLDTTSKSPLFSGAVGRGYN